VNIFDAKVTVKRSFETIIQSHHQQEGPPPGRTLAVNSEVQDRFCKGCQEEQKNGAPRKGQIAPDAAQTKSSGKREKKKATQKLINWTDLG
jgi:cytochrome c5